MKAIILSIGDELALGLNVDTNSAWLAQRLADRGWGVLYHQTVADDLPAMVAAIAHAAELAELVLMSGGLGPTQDDLTRVALAEASGSELVEDAASWQQIQAMLRQRGREPDERNRLQARRPAALQAVANPVGTAPGLRGRLSGAELFAMPGVPAEMRAMFERDVLPALGALGASDRVLLTEKLNTLGVGESVVAERLGDLMARDRNPKVGTTASRSVVSVRIRSEGDDVQRVQRELQQTVQQVRQRLGAAVFSQGEQTLAEAVLGLLVERGLSVVSAESCTGGLLGTMLTDMPGSSASYVGGWISYSNAMKLRELGVDQATLDEHGAVSGPTARAMARGALQRSEVADLSVSITGVAGPDGGSDEKPVGTVWVGLGRRGAEGVWTRALLLNLHGNREVIRRRAALCALQLLRLWLLDEPLETLQWLAGESV